MSGEGVTLVSGGRFVPPTGEAHWWWKGDGAGYQAALYRLKKARGKAADHCCRDCDALAFRWVLTANEQHEDVRVEATTGRPFSFNVELYAPLCARCHRIGKNA